MTRLHTDIETYCELDLKVVGVYRYVAHPSFKVQLLSFAFNDDEPTLVRIEQGEQVPQYYLDALVDPSVIKVAHNAPFEVVCLRRWLVLPLVWEQWRDTMVMAAYLGLPLGLDDLGGVLNLPSKKDAAGKLLIKYFAAPCKATKANGGRTQNLPEHNLEKWERYCAYNVQDVRVEQAVEAYCMQYPQPRDIDWLHWAMDQRINDRGVQVDWQFVDEAIIANDIYEKQVIQQMKDSTGIANPNSLDQIKDWVFAQCGIEIKSLNKDFFKDWKPEDYPPHVASLLKLRELVSRKSASKYKKMKVMRSPDGRLRGQFQYYGANRTGREAGRGVQLQNLKKTPEPKRPKYLGFDTVEVQREAIKQGIIDLIQSDVSEAVSEMVRCSFIPKEGHLLVPDDFAAIEARVVSWLAGEEWQLEVFRTHGKIYEATASQMFRVPIEQCQKSSGNDYRAKGKVASLALGYQGSTGAMITMGALREGLMEDELLPLVYAWRKANPMIAHKDWGLWAKVEKAAKHVVRSKTMYTLQLPYTSLTFSYDRGYMFIELPSGRKLSYYGAHIDGRGQLIYYGLDQKTKRWGKQKTYGGKLVENITQAIARDCLFEAMYIIDCAGVPMVIHVHDEAVAEVPAAVAHETLKYMSAVMDIPPVWAPTLPLSSAGFVTDFYRKD